MIRTLARGLALLALVTAPAMAATPEQARFDALVARAKAEMLTNLPAAARRAETGEQLAARIADPKARGVAQATAAWLEGEAWFRMGDLDRAAPPIARALQLVHRAAPGIQLEGDALLASGNLHGMRTEVADALTDLQRAHRIFVKLGDKRGQAKSLICIGLLYVDAKDYTSALRYLDEALEAYPADAGLALSIFNSRGIIYQDQGQHAKANAEFRRALASARAVKSTDTEAKFLRNIARNQLFAGQVAEAERTIAAARALPQSGSDRDTQLDAVEAQAAFQHGRLAQAGQLIDRAFAGVDLTKTELPLRDAHLTAVTIYQAQHRPDRALAHLQALKRLDDQATRLATQTGTALMAARFNSANQEAKIARLRDAERLRQAREEVQRARTERTLWLGGAGATAIVILLLLIVIMAVRRSRDQVRAANADLAVTNTALGKALAAKTEFLATTSHEIRTPLNGILGMTQVMLADGALAPATRDRLRVVHGAGLTMRALVDDILDVAKMETGNLKVEHAPFELKALLEDASRMWADQAAAKGLAFSVELDRCPAGVEGDSARVRQIVFNLLSNAVKFTATGSVTLRARAADGGVVIEVADTGIGIAPEQQESVFESFKQADASTTRRFGGTGLGLSICRSLAHAMRGEVTLASAVGSGSTFTVTLPLPVLAAGAPACAAGPGGEALLVIDRNPIARAMLRTLFSPHVAAVAFAGSAEEARTCLANGPVGHVLIDDATAKASGDAHAFVAAVVEQAGAAPVILLWTSPAANEETELKALGVHQLVAKPVTGAALVGFLFPGKGTDAQQSSLVSRAA